MPRKQKSPLIVGDLVITHNNRRGRVMRIGQDALGDYIIVKLEFLEWEFAFDPWDLEKVG